MQTLAEKVPGQLEGAIAVARAAIDAQQFDTARAALAPYLSAPTRRVATLMAQIEENEHGDEGRVREWMSRAMRASGDPVWTADGVVSDTWMPLSPNGRLDGFVWKLPLAEIGVSRPIIEFTPAPPAVPAAAPEPKTEAAPKWNWRPSRSRSCRYGIGKSGGKAEAGRRHYSAGSRAGRSGLDSGLDRDPVPEPTSPPAGDAWQRFRQLFR